MGQFTNKILAEFQPPKKWKLGRDLVYTTSDLFANEIKSFHQADFHKTNGDSKESLTQLYNMM